MRGCTGDCNQGRLPCNCAAGIEMDYGKPDRLIFLERERHYHKWDRYIKWLLIIMILYFGFHIYSALAQSTPIIINQPGGGQTVCIVDGRYITCF